MMKAARALILVMMLLLLSGAGAIAQFNPANVCRFTDGRLVFTLDKRWTPAQRKDIGKIYNLDSTLLANAFALKQVINDSGAIWLVRKIDANRLELSKAPAKSSGNDKKEQVFLLDDAMFKSKPVTDRESSPSGVNRLTRNTIVQLSPGKLRFFLPGHRNASTVYLSGSFNAWSTTDNPMARCDSGWTCTILLRPGKYTYKFVIDGKWSNDPYNKLREDDTYGGYNNIFFCYNYRFALKGYPDAKKVVLAASFNNWNESDLRMIRFQGNWVLPIYVREGTHAYKFIVDGEWITDPAAQVNRPDGKGNINSFMGIGDTLTFTLKGYPNAKKVILAGDFNAWNEEELAMTKTAGGWQLPYVLPAGNYTYKFLADGTWITDPGNPYTTGTGKMVNSFLAVKPNYWFRLDQHSDADKVIVSGTFNGWSKEDYRMEIRQGTWWFPMYLKTGKYSYKFVVDNKWITDPANLLWEENEFGTGNSVLWIEQ